MSYSDQNANRMVEQKMQSGVKKKKSRYSKYDAKSNIWLHLSDERELLFISLLSTPRYCYFLCVIYK